MQSGNENEDQIKLYNIPLINLKECHKEPIHYIKLISLYEQMLVTLSSDMYVRIWSYP